jgi:hypothetical protein
VFKTAHLSVIVRYAVVLCLAPRDPDAEHHRADHQQDAY